MPERTYRHGLTICNIVEVLIKNNMQVVTSNQLKEFLEKETKNKFSKNIIHRTITYLLAQGYYTRESVYTYRRSSMTSEQILKQVRKDYSNKEYHKLIIENDLIANKMLEVLEKYHPLAVTYALFLKEIPELVSKSRIVYLKRIQLLIDTKLIKQVSGKRNSFDYVLYKNDTVPAKITRKDFYPLYLRTLNELNVIKAAFISIAEKLKNGEDVKDTLIKTGELVAEMSAN